MTDLHAQEEPRWLTLAREELRKDTREVPGEGVNPRIAALHADLGLPVVSDDLQPWCGVFMGAMLVRAGIKAPRGPRRARNYLAVGTPLQSPKVGCIVVLRRGDASDTTHGHVTMYVGEDPARPGWFLGLGGNQRNRVSIAPYDSSRVLGWRWPGA